MIATRESPAEPAIRIDYVSVADPLTLLELSVVDRTALASIAARLGPTRLIDNLVLGGPPEDRPTPRE